MRFRLTFKTPGAFDRQTVSEDIALECEEGDVGPHEECPACAERMQACENLIDQFVKYDELIVIEFDTFNQTATVVKVK